MHYSYFCEEKTQPNKKALEFCLQVVVWLIRSLANSQLFRKVVSQILATVIHYEVSYQKFVLYSYLGAKLKALASSQER